MRQFILYLSFKAGNRNLFSCSFSLIVAVEILNKNEEMVVNSYKRCSNFPLVFLFVMVLEVSITAKNKADDQKIGPLN